MSKQDGVKRPSALPAHELDWAFFLDVDGTLIEIAETPDAVEVAPRTRAVLERLLTASGGAVALVSGRPVAALDALFAPLTLPAAGLHGLERRDAAGHFFPAPPPAAEMGALRRRLDKFAAAHEGVLIEDKTLSLALHYRAAPDAASAAQDLAAELMDAFGDAFLLQRGKMVLEFRPPGPTKGDVVEAFMAEPPFAGRTPVFIGDDVTDEHGFAAVNRLNGESIRVGNDAPTCARWQTPSISALLDWLGHAPQAA